MRRFKFIYGLLIIIFIFNCAHVPITVTPTIKEPLVDVREIKLENTFSPTIILKGTEFRFDYDVKWKQIDPVHQQLLIFTQKAGENPQKKPGTLSLCDLGNTKILWTVLAFAEKGEFTSDRVIISGYNKIFGLDRNTGEVVWERDGDYYNLDASNNVALTGLITGFDVRFGQDLWSRPINNTWGWTEDTMLDSTLIVAVDGLHTFDLKTGGGWDINMSTGKKDYAKAIATNVALGCLSGCLMGLTGTYVSTPPAKADVYKGLSSNLCIVENEIYYSAMEYFVCVDIHSGKELWRTTLPEQGGKTILCEEDSNILMVGEGYCMKYCYKNNRYIGEYHKYGKPFVAKFDRLTGQEEFFTLIDSQTPVKDLKISSDGYFIISEKALFYFDKDGRENGRVEISDDTEKSLIYGIYQPFIEVSNEILAPSTEEKESYSTLIDFETPTTKVMVQTTKGLIYYDENFDIEKWIPNSILNRQLLKKENLCFIREHLKEMNYGPLKVIDLKAEGKLLGQILISSPVQILEDTIYSWEGNVLKVVPLSPIYSLTSKEY